MPRGLGQAELDIQSFKRDALRVAERCSRKSKKWSNLDEQKQRGLRKLGMRVKNKEIVCFTTDKSGRWSCDTPENYRNACRNQLADHTKTQRITEGEHNEAEKVMNCQALALLRMLGLGDDEKNDRLRWAVVANGSRVPPFYGTRKDHKDVPEDMAEIGPKVRPVCGAEDCATKRASYILCQIGSELIGDNPTHCNSTTDLLEEIERVNQSGKVTRKVVIGSLDVEALYPSLNIDTCSEVVRKKLEESDLRFEGLDWKEIALYLKFHTTEEERVAQGIERYCPKKRTNLGRPAEFTASGSSKHRKERFGPWIFQRRGPNARIVRRMFCLAVKCMIKVTMTAHDFYFDGEIYRQVSGGSIGLDLTGVIADIYMCHWDEVLLEKLEVNDIIVHLYKRYKDDVNLAMETREENPLWMSEESEEARDQKLMKKVKEIANQIDPSIQVTTDCCSNHDDQKTPILDVKVWVGELINEEMKILHCHYMKDVSTRLVMHEESSHGSRMKYNVMVNEIDRIVRNSSPHLPWEESIVPSITYFLKRMTYSGYSQKFMIDSLNGALDKYDVRKRRFEEGQSYYDVSDLSNRKKKADNPHDWYKEEDKYESVLFVEPTWKSNLKVQVEKLLKKYHLKIKVVERVGETVKSILQRSDPFRTNICEREDCLICEKALPVNCRERGVVYELVCTVCERKYRGQTGVSIYERTCKHSKDWRDGLESCPLYRHQELFHPDGEFDFEVRVLSKCFGKPTRRMITEAVKIGELKDDESMNSKREWTYIALDKI